MKDIGELLQENQSEKAELQKEELKITTYALAKAWLYARIACRLAETSIECGGYLVCPKHSTDEIATDAILAKDQMVEEGHYLVRPWQVRQAGQEISRAGNKVLGWWHSHGRLSAFFSRLDDEGQQAVLNAVSGINIRTRKITRKLQLAHTGDSYTDRADPRRVVKVHCEPLAYRFPARISLEIIEPQTVSFCYGLVVTAIDDSLYAEVSCRQLASCCKSITDTKNIASVAICKGSRIRRLETSSLEKEVQRYVHMPRKESLFSRILDKCGLSQDKNTQAEGTALYQPPAQTESAQAQPSSASPPAPQQQYQENQAGRAEPSLGDPVVSQQGNAMVWAGNVPDPSPAARSAEEASERESDESTQKDSLKETREGK